MYRTRGLLQYLTTKSYSYSALSTRPVLVAEHLKQRTLLKVSGKDAADYLQGLITNDIRHIEHASCMYSMFLNTKGRVLYDAIIYKHEESDTYLIECDTVVAGPLEKHLQIYKLRRKINIVSLLQDYEIFVLFNPEKIHACIKKETDESSKKLEVFPCDVIKSDNVTTTCAYKNLLVYRDPRISLLGSRVIAPKNTNIKSDLEEICAIQDNLKPEENYRWARYMLGVGEGVGDLPPGNCFPLEANCDYLHGVSFHKGCYIGQELTARTHHTGIVRKRLMPLIFTKIPGKLPESETVINEGVNLGKLRGIEGNAGLALLRVAKCLELEEIVIGNGRGFTFRPSWWPVEASKDKIVQRNE